MPGCQNRIIELSMTESMGKLFISLENTYAVRPQIIDGLPVSGKKDHGFGTQSIQYTTEKLKGNCHFSLSGDRFVLQIVL
ncbi:MAG: GHKL domain-containing protein [Firmicutes bacterium]|nr:GHKL domain-containing protein [Bacillota bacterium]